ncbi:cyclin-J isoform X2 [Centruroides vittatus]
MSVTEQWWLTEYATEIHDHLRKKELQRVVYRARSPHLPLRRHIINWLADVCKKTNVCRTVKHVAIYFFDFSLDGSNINHKLLHLLALVCIFVAAKLEEKDDLIPKASELNKYLDIPYELSDFTRMELLLLEFFHWDLLMPTAAHFVDYYSVFSLSTTDLVSGQKIKSFYAAKQLLERHINYFLDISLQDHLFLQFPPSLVATSCIAAARVCLILSPMWPVSLQKLTQYRIEQLAPCLSIMLNVLQEEESKCRNN